jgi:hypothetical protein
MNRSSAGRDAVKFKRGRVTINYPDTPWPDTYSPRTYRTWMLIAGRWTIHYRYRRDEFFGQVTPPKADDTAPTTPSDVTRTV